MVRFAAVLRELRGWLLSFPIIRLLVPYTLHLLFGGLAVLFVRELLYEAVSYDGYDTLNLLFNTIPLYLAAYYGFFAGIWLALVSPGLLYLPYAFWGYAFLALFPFHDLGLYDFVSTVLYGVGGALLYRFVSSPASGANSKGTSV